MKILRTALISLAIIAASSTSVYARDSFSLGVNIGGYGYPSQSIGYSQGFAIGYYSAPPVLVYPQPVYYDGAYAPNAYYAPVRVRYAPIVYGYQNHGQSNRGWGHDRGEHRGWSRGNEGHGRNERGHGDRR